MDEKLYELLLKLPRKTLIDILWESLDLMQSYNGRSKTYCITMSMGVKEDPKKEGRYSIPSLKKIKENSQSMLL